MTQRVSNTIPSFTDARGLLLDGGQIYLGTVNADPQTSPIQAFWDVGLTQVALQPIRTLGGRFVNGAIPAQVFIAEDDYSMRILDSDGSLVDYNPSVFTAGIAYQPLDADLTAIAGLSTAEYGRDLLTLTNQEALAAATGITEYTGGPLQNIPSYNGSGFVYYGNVGYTGSRLYARPATDADPTTEPGDIGLFWASGGIPSRITVRDLGNVLRTVYQGT